MPKPELTRETLKLRFRAMERARLFAVRVTKDPALAQAIGALQIDCLRLP